MSQRAAHKQRRERDKSKAKYEKEVENERGKVLLASWEKRSDDMLRHKNVKNLMRKKEEQRQVTLIQRRKMLKALLEKEFYQLQQELKGSFETMEQRRERMIEEASRLQREREVQRQEEVRRLRERQWKDSVDEIRTHKSKLLTSQIAEERLKQLKEHNGQFEVESQKEAVYAREWEKTRMKMLEREVRESKDLAKRNKEMRQLLDIQVRERNLLRDRDEVQLFGETKTLKERWHADAEAAAAKAKAKREHAAQIEREVQAYNKHKRAVESKRSGVEHAFDIKLLNAALDKEAKQMKLEADLKEAQRMEMIDYQDALRQQMIKEVQDNTYLEQLLKQESDKEWKKREDKWAAEAHAREKLMTEVDLSRKEQLRAKGSRRVDEVARDQVWAEQCKSDLQKAESVEHLKSESRLHGRIRNRDFVLAQVEERKQRQQSEVEKELAKLQLEKEAESVYEQKFNALFQEDIGEQDFRRKKVQWYY